MSPTSDSSQGGSQGTVIKHRVSSRTLSPDDANRLGIKLTPANFTRRMRTANGIVRGAPVVIRALELGTIHLSNVSAVINEAAMAHSLLGVSALEKLSSYEVRDGTLTLRR